MGEKYVVAGMKAKCSEGTMENYLTTDTGHGVVYQGQPVLNANDHQKDINLTHFGECKSKKVYEEARKEADEKYKAEEGDGFFTKIGKSIAKTATKAAISVKENFMVNKCDLDTPLPWTFTSKDHMIDGAPALTMESQCACRYGGIITIVPKEEESMEKIEESADESDEKENIIDQFVESMITAASIAEKLFEKKMTFTKESIALLWENMEASNRSIIHQLFNPGDYLKEVMQMGTSFINKDVSELFRNQDLADMDLVIKKYENEIYNQYKEQFTQYELIRKEQNKLNEKLKKNITETERLDAENQLAKLSEQEKAIFENISIMDYLVEMGNELNTMETVTAHKNDIVNFFNMVYTENPIDLKSRVNENADVEYSIWSRPWKKENGATFEQDYAGNWLYGYVGAEYFALPADGEILKYGAGLAQLISDLSNGSSDKSKVKMKYLVSLISGNYGDNINESGSSDAQMIQEGVDAYCENKK